ncbi:possible transcriptional regulator, ArsR family (plasmid) [Rhodococcus jostii RHA1]|uniref:Possible transcriptional regulator, ArsR family n=1 Tax=Rhodococcus jostii (strain RHA1) TaxID=101510 RepID=Q0RV19_RHOJR|nr:metalloregulator ArsR/SmtB family transcription factor [Rhodococcus jostii]ABH00867.1 possible transcriptional regulator, ArsR family [Rhodococcus jostii RHA1]
MGDRLAKTELFDQFARVGKALGSGKRLELLDLLAQGERTVDALARAAGLGLTTASAHLQTLKQANLVATRREGTKVFYRLAGADVAQLFALVRTVANDHLPDVEAAAAAYLGPADTEQVSKDQLLERARSGTVTVLDVRPREEYRAGHIPGAVSIPLDELADHLADLPEDQEIVAYCRGAYCVLAHDAVRLLTDHGRRAARLTEGMLEWRLAALPVDTPA